MFPTRQGPEARRAEGEEYGVKIVQDAKMENGKMAENGKWILAEDLKTGNGRERNRRGRLEERSGSERLSWNRLRHL